MNLTADQRIALDLGEQLITIRKLEARCDRLIADNQALQAELNASRQPRDGNSIPAGFPDP